VPDREIETCGLLLALLERPAPRPVDEPPLRFLPSRLVGIISPTTNTLEADLLVETKRDMGVGASPSKSDCEIALATLVRLHSCPRSPPYGIYPRRGSDTMDCPMSHVAQCRGHSSEPYLLAGLLKPRQIRIASARFPVRAIWGILGPIQGQGDGPCLTPGSALLGDREDRIWSGRKAQ
jgi:hypothetical protein